MKKAMLEIVKCLNEKYSLGMERDRSRRPVGEFEVDEESWFKLQSHG